MKIFRSAGSIACIALVLILFFSWNGILPFDRIARGVYRIFITPLYTFLSTPRSDLARENKDLRDLLETIAGDRVREAILSQRTSAEKIMTTWAEQRSLPSPLLAHVLTRFEEDGNVFYILDRGQQDGVVPHAVVVVGDGILVGRIAQVRRTTALLRLLTQSDQRFSLVREKATQPIGMAHGQNSDDTLRITFVPRAETFAPGDILVTSGLDPGVPRDLLVGTVRESISAVNSPWQELTLRPFAYPSDLMIVGILLFKT